MTKRKHRWSGAGYVCCVCGGIKDGDAPRECPGPGTTFDLWLYHEGAGWWLEDSDIGSIEEAAALLAKQVGRGNTVAGAVLPKGKPLGLFTKQQGM